MFISLRNLLGLRLKSGKNSSREGRVENQKRRRKGRKDRGGGKKRIPGITRVSSRVLLWRIVYTKRILEKGDYDRFVAKVGQGDV